MQWSVVELSCFHRLGHSIGEVNAGVGWELRVQTSWGRVGCSCLWIV